MIPLLDPIPKPSPASSQLQVVSSANLLKYCYSDDVTLLLNGFVFVGFAFLFVCLLVFFLRGDVITIDIAAFLMQILLHL